MKEHIVSRRKFLKIAGTGIAAAAFSQVTGCAAPIVGSREATGGEGAARSRVYFTKHIDAAHLIRLYGYVNEGIYGKTAIKLHTGEPHGPNILPREMVKAFQKEIPDSAIVETNTMYAGARYTTEGHRQTLAVNGWDFCPVDILDEEGDVTLPVRGGKVLQEVAMGAHLVHSWSAWPIPARRRSIISASISHSSPLCGA